MMRLCIRDAAERTAKAHADARVQAASEMEPRILQRELGGDHCELRATVPAFRLMWREPGIRVEAADLRGALSLASWRCKPSQTSDGTSLRLQCRPDGRLARAHRHDRPHAGDHGAAIPGN